MSHSDTSWMEGSPCSVNPEAFFAKAKSTNPREREKAKAAQALCTYSCPVREKCLAYALKNKFKGGVWGGLNQSQRDRLVAKSRRPLAAVQA